MSQLVNFSDSSKTHQLFTWLRDAVVASASLQTFIALLYNSDFSLLGRSTPSVQPINFFFSFVSIQRAQQPRSGRPSNVFQRFDRS